MTRWALPALGLLAACAASVEDPQPPVAVLPQFDACVEMADGSFVGDCEGAG